MTSILSAEQFLSFANRKDVKIFAVNVKGNQYECEYQTTQPDTGHIAPIVSNLLGRLSAQGQQGRCGEGFQSSDSQAGHSNPINSNRNPEEKQGVDEGTGNVHPLSGKLAQVKRVGEHLDCSDTNNGTQPHPASNPQQGIGRRGESHPADKGSDRAYRTELEQRGKGQFDVAQAQAKRTEKNVGPSILTRCPICDFEHEGELCEICEAMARARLAARAKRHEYHLRKSGQRI